VLACEIRSVPFDWPDRIRQLLTETDLKLDAIARKAGFRYIGHICSLFKKRTGMTPGEYRQAHPPGRPG
jgi:AraC-like DNA-binding protein